MGKKIKDTERPAEFSRIRDLVFANAKISYDPSNLVHYETYRKALNRFGLVDAFLMFKYPETVLKYDLTKEEDITGLMEEVASEYSDLTKEINRNPVDMRPTLWPLFRPDYNPKFEAFAEEELSSIEMTLDQIDKIIKTEDDEEEESRGKAKGTSLEGTFGNPVDLAKTIRKIIDLRYIKSFGYSLEGNDGDLSKQDIFAYVQMNLTSEAPFKESEESNKKEEPSTKASSSPLNTTGSTATTASPTKESSSINSTSSGGTSTQSASTNTINPATSKSSESTAVTSSDGTVTSKVGELQDENILDTSPSQAINVNLETKPPASAPGGSTSNSTTASTTSNSTTVNDVNSASSVTSNPSNTSNNTGVTGDKNIMKVENTNNQSSSSTVNESKPEKEKGGFLSKVGNFAKKAGAALNLPSVGELGEQAKGLFGATGANISSRISEVKNSFAINSNKEESNSSPTSSTATNSVNSSNTTATTKPNDILAVPNTGTTSTTSDILKTETQTAMNVEQNKPAVTATQSPVTNQTTQTANQTASTVSNTANSQNTSAPTTTASTVSQNTQSAAQPAGAPAGGGVNVDTNQLAQSITRLERILISGIEVTIKDA